MYNKNLVDLVYLILDCECSVAVSGYVLQNLVMLFQNLQKISSIIIGNSVNNLLLGL